MIDQIEILKRKIDLLGKMSGYLVFAKKEMVLNQISGKDIQNLSDHDDMIFAAFRMRFSEFQERMGKTIRSIAEDQDVKIVGRTDLSVFAEKIGIIDSENQWNTPRNIRNNINHEYTDDPDELRELTKMMVEETDTLLAIHEKLLSYFVNAYRVVPCPVCQQFDCICDNQDKARHRPRN